MKMNKQLQASAQVKMIAAMCIFGTVGILRRYIPISSSVIALLRAAIGTIFLLLIIIVRKEKVHFQAIRRNLFLLILSSCLMGFNWILLFEAYNYTTITTATLCYYMAPTFVVIGAHFLLGDKVTLKKGICVGVALTGMVLLSGVIGTSALGKNEWKGILLGLAAAVFYACVILLNQKITVDSALERTTMQIAIAAIILIPYCIITVPFGSIEFSLRTVLLLLVAGIIYTGLPYLWYFSAMKQLTTQKIALSSYIDPIVAIFASAILLQEAVTLQEAIGTVLILGAAYCSDK